DAALLLDDEQPVVVRRRGREHRAAADAADLAQLDVRARRHVAVDGRGRIGPGVDRLRAGILLVVLAATAGGSEHEHQGRVPHGPDSSPAPPRGGLTSAY